MERRAFHPYRRLELTIEDVAEELETALEHLGYADVSRPDDGTVLPGPYGHPTCPDVAAQSLMPLDIDRGTTLGLVHCPALSGWRPKRLAARLDRTDGLWPRVLEVDAFEALSPGGHAVRVASAFETAWADDSEAIVERLRAAIGDHVLDLLVLPPCIGSTHNAHVDLWSTLAGELETPIAEWPAARDAVFGWRLDRWLRSRDGGERIQERVVALESDGGAVERIELASGDTLAVDGVVIATGCWIGGGLPTEPPMREPLSDVPLWVDGAPLSNPESVHPPDHLGERPWSDHRLFRAGVAIDARGRPLDRAGAPAFDNTVAAGRLLAGFHPHRDGCAMGVDLVSGTVAARRLFDELSSDPIDR
jgi:anaerobic glycerol-3-phosphate dehydrogenase